MPFKDASKRKEYAKKYYKEYEKLDRVKAIRKKYANNHKNERSIIAKQWYVDHKTLCDARNKQWVKNNRSRYNELQKPHCARRTHELGYTLLNDPFYGCEGHHIDTEFVINIPLELHRSNFHRQSDNNSMLRMNILAWDYLETCVL